MKTMKLNVLKLISPDFALGKLLTFLRALYNLFILILAYPSRRSLRIASIVLRVKPRFTMVTSKNLISLYNLVQRVDNLQLPGDIVECGVWNGGSAVVMGAAQVDGGNQAPCRTMWLFDSFQGLPLPGEKDGVAEQVSYFEGWCKGEPGKVEQAFEMLGVPMDHVKITPGWFEETLHTAPIDQISILHVDADWYDSIKVVLDTFYDKVVKGGFVVFDDYGYWKGCERAIADYFVEHGITGVTMKQTDHGGAYFQKLT
jgi:O-methyltransferase